MDKGAGSGLLVACRTVAELEMPINFRASKKWARVGYDQEITSTGQVEFSLVELTWKVVRSGLRTRKENFDIFESSHIDVILGWDYLIAKGILSDFDITPLRPLAPAITESPCTFESNILRTPSSLLICYSL